MAAPTLDGIDYYSRDSGPAPQVTADAGLSMVFRYLFDGGKGLTDAEVTDLHGEGLAIGCYYEAHQGYLLEPANARGYGVDAANQARLRGVPLGVPICHSLDVDTGPSQFETVAQSIRAINKVRGRLEGFYGEADAIDYLWDRGLISFAVNTAAVGWSGGRVSSHAAVWQYKNDTPWHGHNVDFLTIRNQAAVNAALWFPAGHNPTGGLMSAEGDTIIAQVHAFADEYRDDMVEVKRTLAGLGAQTHAAAVQDATRDAAIVAAIGDGTGPVDVGQLAGALGARLGPEIAAALGAALTKGAAA